MKQIRKAGESLQEYLNELKIGGDSVYDEVTNYEITKCPGGYIYKNEYVGMCFVPDVKESVGAIKNSVAKTEPKKRIEK